MAEPSEATAAARGRRGRPVEFERDAVVAAAMGAFWTDGFDRTTLGALEAATGADRSTLYNSFGGKTGLYASAAAGYVDRVVSEMLAPFSDPTLNGLEPIVAFLDQLEAVTTSSEYPVGCFIVNDLGSPNRDDAATRRYLDELSAAFCAVLVADGVGGDLASQRTSLLLAVVVGVNAAANHGVDLATTMIASARATVLSWARES